MKGYEGKLFHEDEAFKRETIAKRMEQFGFKNMARMELFLWDMELFLQIQEILKDKVVLKGGAATQFYLPTVAQRTSVDIDMLFCGSREEAEDTLQRITEKFANAWGLFTFHEHIPKKPKTTLPLHTYYVAIPSVLTPAERNIKKEEVVPGQELKIEFILQPEQPEYILATGEDIFAVNSRQTYQILPLNILFADKLTTLGPETIGIQNSRMDEQVKQFYDIWMLTKYRITEFDGNIIKNKYLSRAKEECFSRQHEPFDLDEIKADVRKQLLRMEMADNGEDQELKKTIHDFNSLYLNANVEYNPQTVACGAALVRLMYESIIDDADWKGIMKALEIEEYLQLKHLSGKEKGQKTKELRELLIREFGSYSALPTQVLKGKNIRRVFWAVIDHDNVDEVEKAVLEHMDI